MANSPLDILAQLLKQQSGQSPNIPMPTGPSATSAYGNAPQQNPDQALASMATAIKQYQTANPVQIPYTQGTTTVSQDTQKTQQDQNNKNYAIEQAKNAEALKADAEMTRHNKAAEAAATTTADARTTAALAAANKKAQIVPTATERANAARGIIAQQLMSMKEKGISYGNAVKHFYNTLPDYNGYVSDKDIMNIAGPIYNGPTGTTKATNQDPYGGNSNSTVPTNNYQWGTGYTKPTTKTPVASQPAQATTPKTSWIDTVRNTLQGMWK